MRSSITNAAASCRRTQPGYGTMSCPYSLRTPVASGASPVAGERGCGAAQGEGIVSEQLPREYAPPGWFPDPTGLQALRWWDGTRWGQQTRSLPGRGQEPQLQYPVLQPYGQQPGQPSFTPDPQYGTPPGQPPYQAQPNGMPSQPPYPGPGNSHDYGPQPPRRRRKRHWCGTSSRASVP